MSLDQHFEEPTAIRTNLDAIFVSLELSRSTWLITSVSPGGGERMSKWRRKAPPVALAKGIPTLNLSLMRS